MATPEIGAKCIRPSTNGACIIFIHGILSDAEKAWTNDNGVSWPQLLIDERDLQDLGIYVFSYRSDIFSRTYSVSDVVDSLREYFDVDNMWEKDSLVFVCHSMGGIVARRFIVANQTQLIQHGTKLGLFLIASPSLGSNDANAVHFIAQLLRNSQANILRFSQTNQWLNDLDKDFLSLKESKKISIVGKELVEDEPIRIKHWISSTQVVEPFSAARYFAHPFKVPFSDHISISKPANAQALQHKSMVHFLKECVLMQGPTLSPFIKALAGRWEGREVQKNGPGGKSVEYPIFISIAWDGGALKGGFRFIFEENGVVQVDETLPLEGFTYERFVLMNFRDVLSGKVQFGSLLLELSSDGEMLKGLDVGFGYTVEKLATGICTLRKKKD